ncbi:MAG: tetratricopeptide repeat protein [Deltaproteobacteria bacterium]|nr:tetratricopeptide repeat protein [Deltaproteobacteria bacterium]
MKRYFTITPSLIFQWIKVWKTWPELYWIKAASCFRENDFRQAANLYKVGLLSHPKHPAARCAMLDLAYCYYKLGSLGEAIDILFKLIKQKPYFRDAFLLLVKCLRFREERVYAFRVARNALRLFPSDHAVISQYLYSALSLPLTAFAKNEVHQLISTVTQKITEDSPYYKDIICAGCYYSYFNLNKEEAIESLSKLLATGMPPYEAVILRASIYEIEERVEQARFQYTRAMRRCVEDYRPLLGLARCYLKEGSFSFSSELSKAACKASEWHSIESIDLLIQSLAKLEEIENIELYQAKLNFLENKQRLEVSRLIKVSDSSLVNF